MQSTEEQKIKSHFFIVPNVIFEKGLSSKAIVVYCCLLRHAGEKRRCFPSRKRISVECSLGVTTVDRALTELITAGLVKKENRKNVIGGKTSNMYFINDP